MKRLGMVLLGMVALTACDPARAVAVARVVIVVGPGAHAFHPASVDSHPREAVKNILIVAAPAAGAPSWTAQFLKVALESSSIAPRLRVQLSTSGWDGLGRIPGTVDALVVCGVESTPAGAPLSAGRVPPERVYRADPSDYERCRDDGVRDRILSSIAAAAGLRVGGVGIGSRWYNRQEILDVLDRSMGRGSLPEYQVIPASATDELTKSPVTAAEPSFLTWEVSHGDAGSRRYSALKLINRANVGRLEEAWTYHSRDGHANVQSNPIVVGGVMFAPTAGRAIVALDATTGRELWRHPMPAPAVPGLEDAPARRGLIYWAGNARQSPRLVLASGKWVYALDPKNGALIDGFGEHGRAPLPTGGTSVGVICADSLIIAGFSGDIFAYDLGSGAERWRFHTIPQPSEPGGETWQGKTREGADCWGGLSADVGRQIVYAAIGNPHPLYVGGDRAGDNLYSDCLVALDARTGRRLWYFQNVPHDLWDLDNPAPPNLVTLDRDGVRVDAVACVTKVGNTLLFDRVTGKPIFPIRLRRAPLSRIPGETTAPYQPDPQLPEPFSSPEFRPDEITDLSSAAHNFVLRQVERSTYGWFEPPTEAKPLLYHSSRGGAEWTGACVDVPTGRLYVSVNHIVSKVTIYSSDERDDGSALKTPGGEVYLRSCAVCHGPDRQGAGMVPPLLGLRRRMTTPEVTALLKTGRGQMPPAPQLSAADEAQLLSFLFRRQSSSSGQPAQLYTGGFTFLTDAQGYPGIKPPWGELVCLDLNRGKIAWRVPLGEYEELVKVGIPPTGTENFGGPTVTAGGLVFCAGTRDRKLRAFDQDTGRELWSATLPWVGSAPPAVYESGGREYVVVAATGGGKLGGPTGDAYVAFSLPSH